MGRRLTASLQVTFDACLCWRHDIAEHVQLLRRQVVLLQGQSALSALGQSATPVSRVCAFGGWSPTSTVGCGQVEAWLRSFTELAVVGVVRRKSLKGPFTPRCYTAAHPRFEDQRP